MASTNVITSLGAADFDTKELAANLVAAAKEPRQKIIDAEKKRAEVAISSTSILKNGLAALASAAVDIASTSKLNQVAVTSSNSAMVAGTASPDSTPAAGSYTITINTLASPKRLVSAFSDNYVAPGGLVVTLADIPGMAANPPTIDISAKTPSQIASSINLWIKRYAPGSGLTATVVDTQISTDDEPRSLRMIIQGASGTADSFSLKVGTVDSIDSHTAALFPANGVTDATKARFTLNDVPVERSTNKITDVIQGITLDLNGVSGSPVTITAKPDPSAIISGVQNFVDTYNVIAGFLKKALGPAVVGDEVAGSLKNDAVARGVLAQLRSKITSRFSELDKNVSITHFSSLGVEFDRNGILQFKSPDKFKTAYENATADVVTALSNGTRNLDPQTARPSGLAGDVARLAYSLTSSSSSAVQIMSKGYEESSARLDRKQAALDSYVQRLTEQYEKQFSALDTVLASFKNTRTQLEKSLSVGNNN